MKHLKVMAFIASAFSIVFSFSIVGELESFVNQATLILVGIFILFILVMNEYFKVSELAKKFQSENYSILIVVTTFIISVVLSSIGIYFYTNKTQDQEMRNAELLSSKQLDIEIDYTGKIDSLTNTTLSSDTYLQMNDKIAFWKNRICRTAEERNTARANIVQLEKYQADMEKNFNEQKAATVKRLENLKSLELSTLDVSMKNKQTVQNKGKFLFYILFTLVIITEIMIVYIQYRLTTFFTKQQQINLLTVRNLFKSKRNTLKVDDIRYSPIFNEPALKDQNIRAKAVTLWFLLGNLNIIDSRPNHKNEVIDSDNCYKTLKSYYESVNEKI